MFSAIFNWRILVVDIILPRMRILNYARGKELLPFLYLITLYHAMDDKRRNHKHEAVSAAVANAKI